MFQRLRSKAGAMSASGALVLGVLAGPAAVTVAEVIHLVVASESESATSVGGGTTPALTVGSEHRSQWRAGAPVVKQPADDVRLPRGN